MDLDSAGEPPQRVDVRWDGELVEVLAVIPQLANVELSAAEIQSSVQHVERVVLGARFSVNTASVSPAGDPSSWQSYALAEPAVCETLGSSREQKRHISDLIKDVCRSPLSALTQLARAGALGTGPGSGVSAHGSTAVAAPVACGTGAAVSARNLARGLNGARPEPAHQIGVEVEPSSSSLASRASGPGLAADLQKSASAAGSSLQDLQRPPATEQTGEPRYWPAAGHEARTDLELAQNRVPSMRTAGRRPGRNRCRHLKHVRGSRRC
jgi:hypothetical protein